MARWKQARPSRARRRPAAFLLRGLFRWAFAALLLAVLALARTRRARRRPAGVLMRRLLRGALAAAAAFVFIVSAYAVINPPTTPYMLAESLRLGGIERKWVDIEKIAPAMARSVVAAEDANFCLHWGFDVAAIRAAIDSGGRRGASTISQQVAKNAYLWHGRSWARKALEAGITPVMEFAWSKRRILEVYLNIAEFDEGVFGIEAAAQHYFGVPAANLGHRQSARLAAVLPDPKGRSASRPAAPQRRRAAAIRSGARTILADGRSACFES